MRCGLRGDEMSIAVTGLGVLALATGGYVLLLWLNGVFHRLKCEEEKRWSEKIRRSARITNQSTEGGRPDRRL